MGNNKSTLILSKSRYFYGAPAGIRTPDTLLKRQVLCLLSYWGIGWDGGTRTHYIGVKVRCVTITLHPNAWILLKEAGTAGLFNAWGGIWGSNPRHPEPQSGALPTELIPPCLPLYCKPISQLCQEDEHFLCRGFPGDGTPRGIRTPDLLLRRQLLYPAELLALVSSPPSEWSG